MAEVGCARPTGGPVGGSAEQEKAAPELPTQRTPSMERSMVRVGRKAPDFTAPVFHEGKFGSVTLSEHLGKWVLLCFYPGDYTFV